MFCPRHVISKGFQNGRSYSKERKKEKKKADALAVDYVTLIFKKIFCMHTKYKDPYTHTRTIIQTRTNTCYKTQARIDEKSVTYTFKYKLKHTQIKIGIKEHTNTQWNTQT